MLYYFNYCTSARRSLRERLREASGALAAGTIASPWSAAAGAPDTNGAGADGKHLDVGDASDDEKRPRRSGFKEPSVIHVVFDRTAPPPRAAARRPPPAAERARYFYFLLRIEAESINYNDALVALCSHV
ncbi:Protein scalloped [Eumeta japonica]|uniref:Protein scalloped n=1 Tax=Eumeta variegata TaxID=151549 RepID=A0A4C1VXZ6_EUMVA|nr:Protein scalloped [Eumeta japonica]